MQRAQISTKAAVSLQQILGSRGFFNGCLDPTVLYFCGVVDPKNMPVPNMGYHAEFYHSGSKIYVGGSKNFVYVRVCAVL